MALAIPTVTEEYSSNDSEITITDQGANQDENQNNR